MQPTQSRNTYKRLAGNEHFAVRGIRLNTNTWKHTTRENQIDQCLESEFA